jgi:hypothetical protein
MILQNNPCIAGYDPANNAAINPCDAEMQQLTRMMRDMILQIMRTNGPARRGNAAINPCDAGYYSAKFGSNGPARRGNAEMGPRAAEILLSYQFFH